MRIRVVPRKSGRLADVPGSLMYPLMRYDFKISPSDSSSPMVFGQKKVILWIPVNILALAISHPTRGFIVQDFALLAKLFLLYLSI